MLMAYIIFSSLITISVGCILHFVYDWMKKKKSVALIGAINESTWEHIKIGLIPALLFNSIYLLTFHDPLYYLPTFLPSLAAALLIILIAIPGIFYLKNIFIKKEVVWQDILIFCIAIILAQCAFKAIFTFYSNPYNFIDCPSSLSCDYYGSLIVPNCIIILSIIFIIFILVAIPLFTFYPPRNFLFIDPRNKKYGFKGGEKKRHLRRAKGKKATKK